MVPFQTVVGKLTLSTTEYTLGKIVHWDDEGEWYKFGDRKIYIRQHELIEALKNENFKVKGLINKGIEYAEIKAKMADFQELMPKRN